MRVNKKWQPDADSIWREERDRFIVLLHFYNGLDFADRGCLRPGHVMRALGLSSPQTDDLVKSLLGVNFLGYSSEAPGITITPPGVDYIEVGRGRRQSIRLLDPAGPICFVPD